MEVMSSSPDHNSADRGISNFVYLHLRLFVCIYPWPSACPWLWGFTYLYLPVCLMLSPHFLCGHFEDCSINSHFENSLPFFIVVSKKRQKVCQKLHYFPWDFNKIMSPSSRCAHGSHVCLLGNLFSSGFMYQWYNTTKYINHRVLRTIKVVRRCRDLLRVSCFFSPVPTSYFIFLPKHLASTLFVCLLGDLFSTSEKFNIFLRWLQLLAAYLRNTRKRDSCHSWPVPA